MNSNASGSGLAYIEITTDPVQTGKPRQNAAGFMEAGKTRQNAYLHQGTAYPLPFKIAVDDREGPLRPGFYLIGGECFRTGQYGPELTVSKMQLVPAEAARDALDALTGSSPKLAAVGGK